MKVVLRSILAVLPLVALLSVGCGGASGEGAGGGGGEPFPANTMELYGRRLAINSAAVRFNGERRYVELYVAGGTMLEFAFDLQGDPAQTANQLPLGDWTAFDAEFVAVTFYNPGTPGQWVTYASPVDSLDGTVTMNGAAPDTLTVDAAFVFSIHEKPFRVRYSGPYEYSSFL